MTALFETAFEEMRAQATLGNLTSSMRTSGSPGSCPDVNQTVESHTIARTPQLLSVEYVVRSAHYGITALECGRQLLQSPHRALQSRGQHRGADESGIKVVGAVRVTRIMPPAPAFLRAVGRVREIASDIQLQGI